MDRDRFASCAHELGLTLSAEQLAAFEAFEEALYAANSTRNLTRVPREDCWRRHFLDSLLIHDLIPTGDSVLDVGTGPGFPAWPLACARPDLHVTGLDSNGKMIGFLREHLLFNLEAVQARAEEWEVASRFRFITGRAVAPLPIQLEISAPLAAVGGLVVPMRTGSDHDLAPESLGALGLRLERVEHRNLPAILNHHNIYVYRDDREDAPSSRVFPVYRKFRESKPQYPRSWAEIRKKPLPSSPSLLSDSSG